MCRHEPLKWANLLNKIEGLLMRWVVPAGWQALRVLHPRHVLRHPGQLAGLQPWSATIDMEVASVH